MRNSLIAFIAFWGSCTYSNAQISIRTEVNTKPTQQIEKYDSLSNFNLNYDIIANEYQTEETALTNINGQFRQFIGQSIYILPFTQKQLSFHKNGEVAIQRMTDLEESTIPLMDLNLI